MIRRTWVRIVEATTTFVNLVVFLIIFVLCSVVANFNSKTEVKIVVTKRCELSL